MHGFPKSLILHSSTWLLPRSRFRAQSTEDHYRAQGLLRASDVESVPVLTDAEGEIAVRTSDPGDPLLSAPLTQVAGGTIYFSGGSRPDMGAVFRVMDVLLDRRSYIAIGSHSKYPIHSRYLDELWILWSPSAKEIFGLEDAELPGDQEMTIQEALEGFIDRQIDKWIEPGRPYSGHLEGALGGDGEYAREALGFGFHVDGGSGCFYRIWSRPWVVLK